MPSFCQRFVTDPSFILMQILIIIALASDVSLYPHLLYVFSKSAFVDAINLLVNTILQNVTSLISMVKYQQCFYQGFYCYRMRYRAAIKKNENNVFNVFLNQQASYSDFVGFVNKLAHNKSSEKFPKPFASHFLTRFIKA